MIIATLGMKACIFIVCFYTHSIWAENFIQTVQTWRENNLPSWSVSVNNSFIRSMHYLGKTRVYHHFILNYGQFSSSSSDDQKLCRKYCVQTALGYQYPLPLEVSQPDLFGLSDLDFSLYYPFYSVFKVFIGAILPFSKQSRRESQSRLLGILLGLSYHFERDNYFIEFSHGISGFLNRFAYVDRTKWALNNSIRMAVKAGQWRVIPSMEYYVAYGDKKIRNPIQKFQIRISYDLEKIKSTIFTAYLWTNDKKAKWYKSFAQLGSGEPGWTVGFSLSV